MITLIAQLLMGYKKKLAEGKLIFSQSEIEKFNQCANHLDAFLNVQTNWLADGAIAHFWKQYELEKKNSVSALPTFDLSQEDLVDESRLAIIKGINFTKIMVETLITHIQPPDGCYYSAKSNDYKTFLSDLGKLCHAAQKSIHQFQLKLQNYTTDCILENDIYELATQLNGRYIYSNQGYDPLYTAKELGGACFGHVMNWASVITKTGRCLSMPRVNLQTFAFQQLQSDYVDDEEKILRCITINDIWFAVNQFMHQCDDNHIYACSLRYMTKGTSGHIFGIRKLVRGEIEFFDSNFGLFIFPQNTFKLWFVQLLATYYLDSSFELYIMNIGQQPPHAGPSIPPMQLDRASYPSCIESNYPVLYFSAIASVRPELYEYLLIEQRKCVVKIERVIDQKRHTKIMDVFDDDEGDKLKEMVIAVIENEITRISSTWYGEHELKIHALRELQQRILVANPCLCLMDVVNHWLLDFSSYSNLTYDMIIRSNRIESEANLTNCYRFIDSLVHHYEINVNHLRSLQYCLLNTLIDYTNRYMELFRSEEIPSTIREINSIVLSDKNNMKILSEIKNKCSSGYSIFSFFSYLNDDATASFVTIMNQLELNDPTSLIQSNRQLNNAMIKLEKQEMEHSHSPSISRSVQ